MDIITFIIIRIRGFVQWQNDIWANQCSTSALRGRQESKARIRRASTDAAAGKTSTGEKWITANAVYDRPVEISVKLDSGPVEAAFERSDTLTVTGLTAEIINLRPLSRFRRSGR